MLDGYCHNVLAAELRKPDYDGMTADEGWAWLCLPQQTQQTHVTGALLTPVVAAKVLGPVKANVLAARTRAARPDIADALMREGVNLSDPLTAAFLGSLVGGPISQADVDALLALGTRTVIQAHPPRFGRRFGPAQWPHVAADGTPGGPDDGSIRGFPNAIERDEFDRAWAEARGN